MSHLAVSVRLGFAEQRRRPLLLVLLVGLPFFFITRAIAVTETTSRMIGLPGSGGWVSTTMRDIHGADMAAITVGFLAGLVGVFVLKASREADRRLVVAGYSPWQALVPRLLVLGTAVFIVVVVSIAVTALSFTPQGWLPFVAGIVAVGMIYGLIGALVGAFLGPLGATYVMLFGAMLDLGIAQNPMFGSGTPPGWAAALPGHGPVRMIVDGAFAHEFHAGTSALVSIGWAAGLAVVVTGLLLRRLSVTP